MQYLHYTTASYVDYNYMFVRSCCLVFHPLLLYYPFVFLVIALFSVLFFIVCILFL